MLDPQLLASVGEAHDLDTLTIRVVKAAHELGFALVSGVLIQGRLGSPTAMVQSFGNPPEAYLESSKSLDEGLRDPVLGQLLSRPGFANYDQVTYVRSGVADLWDIQAAYGYKCGVAVSHHAPSHGEAFLLGVDGPDRFPTEGAGALRIRAALQLLALQAQQAMDRIARPAVTPRAAAAGWAAQRREGVLSYASRGGFVKIEELRSAITL
jgi:hypothetical protein